MADGDLKINFEAFLLGCAARDSFHFELWDLPSRVIAPLALEMAVPPVSVGGMCSTHSAKREKRGKSLNRHRTIEGILRLNRLHPHLIQSSSNNSSQLRSS